MRLITIAVIFASILSVTVHAGWKSYPLNVHGGDGCRGLNGYDISADGSKIVTITCKSVDLRVFDIRTNQLVKMVSASELNAQAPATRKVAVRFSPNGKEVYAIVEEVSKSATAHHKLIRYDLEHSTAEVVTRYPVGYRYDQYAIRERLQFSPNGKLLLVSDLVSDPVKSWSETLFSFDPKSKKLTTIMSGEKDSLHPIRKIDDKKMQIGRYLFEFESKNMKQVGKLPEVIYELPFENIDLWESYQNGGLFVWGNDMYFNGDSYKRRGFAPNSYSIPLGDTFYTCNRTNGLPESSQSCLLKFNIESNKDLVSVKNTVNMLTQEQSKDRTPMVLSPDAPYALVVDAPRSNYGNEKMKVSLFRLDNFTTALSVDEIPTGGYVDFGFEPQLRTINEKHFFVLEGYYGEPKVYILDESI